MKFEIDYDIDYSKKHDSLIAKIIVTREMLRHMLSIQLLHDKPEVYHALIDIEHELYKEEIRDNE